MPFPVPRKGISLSVLQSSRADEKEGVEERTEMEKSLKFKRKDMKSKKNEIVIFEAQDGSITLDVNLADETVWLNRQQLAVLFGRDVKTIGKHISNALSEELDESVVANFRPVDFF